MSAFGFSSGVSERLDLIKFILWVWATGPMVASHFGLVDGRCNDRDDYFMGLHSRNDRRLRNAEDLQVSERLTLRL